MKSKFARVLAFSFHCSLAFSLAALADDKFNLIDRLNAQIMANSPLVDYLIQDVCVDDADHVVNGDPANCAHHRNIRIGEKVPYLRTDFDRAYDNRTYQALFSYPVPGRDGSLKIMTLKTNLGNFTPAYVMPPYDITRDGYDLLDLSGKYVSAIRTSDGGCYDQKIEGPNERRNGWIFFATDMSIASKSHSITMTRLSRNVPATCGKYMSTTHSDAAYDVWNPPVPVPFETGKTLQSIVTYHYTNKDLKKDYNAMERYFFTREYGFTRWEAWMTLKQCQRDFKTNLAVCDPSSAQNFLRGRCGPVSPIPATAVWGYQPWVRIDCRDSTNVIQLNTPQIPLYQPSPAFAGMAEDDGLKDIDAASVFAAAH